MNENVIIISGLLILSVISGMLGLGVAFAAIPSGVLFVMGGKACKSGKYVVCKIRNLLK